MGLDTQKMPKTATKKSNKVKTSKEGEKFAVIETGGKQYQVFEGSAVKIEKLSGKHKKGEKIVFDRVLLVDNGKDTLLGNPYLKGATVEATLEEEGRGKKTEVLRFKSKSRYLKRGGHRQPYMEVKVLAIK